MCFLYASSYNYTKQAFSVTYYEVGSMFQGPLNTYTSWKGLELRLKWTVIPHRASHHSDGCIFTAESQNSIEEGLYICASPIFE